MSRKTTAFLPCSYIILSTGRQPERPIKLSWPYSWRHTPSRQWRVTPAVDACPIVIVLSVTPCESVDFRESPVPTQTGIYSAVVQFSTAPISEDNSRWMTAFRCKSTHPIRNDSCTLRCCCLSHFAILKGRRPDKLAHPNTLQRHLISYFETLNRLSLFFLEVERW